MHPFHHAAAHPDKPAYIIAETGETVTYGELDARSNQGAHLFRSLGLKAGDGIAFLPRQRAAVLRASVGGDSGRGCASPASRPSSRRARSTIWSRIPGPRSWWFPKAFWMWPLKAAPGLEGVKLFMVDGTVGPLREPGRRPHVHADNAYRRRARRAPPCSTRPAQPGRPKGVKRAAAADTPDRRAQRAWL